MQSARSEETASRPPPLVVRVVGEAAPKGSSRAMLRGGRPVNVPSGSNANRAKLGDWKGAVVAAYTAAAAPDPKLIIAGKPPTSRTLLSGPIAIGLIFLRPMRSGDTTKQGYPKTASETLPEVKPDADKLERSTLDALTTAGAWKDDAQIAIVHKAKIYVRPGAATGAVLVIGRAYVELDGRVAEDVLQRWQIELGNAVIDLESGRRDGVQAEVDARKGRLVAKRTRNGTAPELPPPIGGLGIDDLDFGGGK